MIRLAFSLKTFYPWGAPDAPEPDVGAIVLCHLEPWASTGAIDPDKAAPFQLEMRFVEHDAWDDLKGPSDRTTRNTVVGWRPIDADRAKYAALYGELQG